MVYSRSSIILTLITLLILGITTKVYGYEEKRDSASYSKNILKQMELGEFSSDKKDVDSDIKFAAEYFYNHRDEFHSKALKFFYYKTCYDLNKSYSENVLEDIIILTSFPIDINYREEYDAYVSEISDSLENSRIVYAPLIRQAFKSLLNEQKLNSYRIGIRDFSICTGIVFMILLIVIFSYLLHKSNRQIENLQLQFAELISGFDKQLNELDFTPVTSRIIITESPESDTTSTHSPRTDRDTLKSALTEDLLSLQKLTTIYSDSNIPENEKNAYKKEILSKIKYINKKYSYGKLESHIDQESFGIIKRLRTEIPKLNHKELLYIALALAGCKNILIAWIMNETPHYCRTLKSRILKKINDSDSPAGKEAISRIK